MGTCKNCGIGISRENRNWFHVGTVGWSKCYNYFYQTLGEDRPELRGFDAEPLLEEDIINRVLNKYH